MLCNVQKALDIAVQIKDFIVNDLNRHYEADRFCFSYTPLDSNFAHNSNLLGASLLIRLSHSCGIKELQDIALSSLAYTVNYQRPDGAWGYAETDIQGWVDSFHTGFNLQALQYFIVEGYASHCLRQYNLGLKYYTDNFFLPDGTPKYYDRKVFPMDIHSPCQAIVVLSHELGRHYGMADKVLRWTLQNMYNSKGYFYFRKGRFFTNKISYMRWSQAWAFHSLTSFLYNKITRQSEELMVQTPRRESTPLEELPSSRILRDGHSRTAEKP